MTETHHHTQTRKSSVQALPHSEYHCYDDLQPLNRKLTPIININKTGVNQRNSAIQSNDHTLAFVSLRMLLIFSGSLIVTSIVTNFNPIRAAANFATSYIEGHKHQRSISSKSASVTYIFSCVWWHPDSESVTNTESFFDEASSKGVGIFLCLYFEVCYRD